jgi:hypothetical protein
MDGFLGTFLQANAAQHAVFDIHDAGFLSGPVHPDYVHGAAPDAKTASGTQSVIDSFNGHRLYLLDMYSKKSPTITEYQTIASLPMGWA